MTGKVFSIEEFSTYDGPSIRTTVFMKGCPLSCNWCHNPEGQSFATEFLRNPNGCAGCGECIKAGISKNGRTILTEKSMRACKRGLVRKCGTDYTPEELAEKLNKNADILISVGGGITFSGGEPLCAADFIVETAALLKRGMSVALQTSGYCPSESFEKVLNVCDYVLYDLKIIDGAKFKSYCGADNSVILRNYRILASSGKEFVTRIPLIPTVTDTVENITDIARTMRAAGAKKAELMPYNKFAGSKYINALREYKPRFDESIPVEYRAEIFARYGIQTKVM